MKNRLNKLGISHTDLLIESFWGNPTLENFLNILVRVPDGISAIMVLNICINLH